MWVKLSPQWLVNLDTVVDVFVANGSWRIQFIGGRSTQALEEAQVAILLSAIGESLFKS